MEINVLIALGFVFGAVAILVGVWYYALRKAEKEEAAARRRPDIRN